MATDEKAVGSITIQLANNLSLRTEKNRINQCAEDLTLPEVKCNK